MITAVSKDEVYSIFEPFWSEACVHMVKKVLQNEHKVVWVEERNVHLQLIKGYWLCRMWEESLGGRLHVFNRMERTICAHRYEKMYKGV